jgi:hypothetical protein
MHHGNSRVARPEGTGFVESGGAWSTNSPPGSRGAADRGARRTVWVLIAAFPSRRTRDLTETRDHAEPATSPDPGSAISPSAAAERRNTKNPPGRSGRFWEISPAGLNAQGDT